MAAKFSSFFWLTAAVFAAIPVASGARAQSGFHHAPASAAAMHDPYTGAANAQAGQQLYAQRCAACHGQNAQGMGNIAALDKGPTQAAKPGEIFWFITRGSIANGMPPWSRLPEKQRWQVVTYLKSLGAPVAGAARRIDRIARDGIQ